MGKIMNSKGKCMLCIISAIIFGLIIGWISLTLLVSYRIDEYHKQIGLLVTAIEERDMKLRKFEESTNKNKYVLRDIDVIIDFEDDQLEKMVFEKHIKQKYSVLIGKEIQNIDLDMVSEVIHNRIFKVDNREYQLYVSKILLSEVMKIWVTIESL